MFDAAQFLDQSVTEANDTKVIPVPVGEYLAIATEVKARQWTSKSDPSKTGVTLDINWEIDDAAVKQLLGRDKVSCKQGLMLDITESGGLDMGKGKNVGLGRLRDALNLNNPGQAFSFSQIPGRMAKVKVEHRTHEDQIFAEIKAVARVG